MAMEFRADLDLGNPEIDKRIAHQAVVGSIAISESPYDSGVRIDLPPETKVTLESSDNDYGNGLKVDKEEVVDTRGQSLQASKGTEGEY